MKQKKHAISQAVTLKRCVVIDSVTTMLNFNLIFAKFIDFYIVLFFKVSNFVMFFAVNWLHKLDNWRCSSNHLISVCFISVLSCGSWKDLVTDTGNNVTVWIHFYSTVI